MILDYLEKGQGQKVIVFLHGFCESKEIWEDLLSMLAAEGYRCIALDLPGFGLQIHDDLQPDINYFAKKVHQFLQDISSPVLMIGHSLGGYVALAYAELFPEKLQGICLFHSTTYADSDEKKANRDKVADFISKNGVHDFIPQLFGGLIAPANATLLKDKLSLIILKSRLTTQPEGAINATIAMRNRPDRLQILQYLGKPAAFIAGKNDTVIRLPTLEEQARLTGATLYVMPDSGHLGMIEEPQLSFEILKKVAQQTF